MNIVVILILLIFLLIFKLFFLPSRHTIYNFLDFILVLDEFQLF